MTVYIAFLRGINVGGHKIIKMAELRVLLETMGLTHVQTYIQSGNILFKSEEQSDQLIKTIENKLMTTFDFSVPVILRTSTELYKIIADCPFSVDNLAEGESIHLSLLAERPSKEAVNQLFQFQSDQDEFHIEGTEIYLYLRQSIRNSKLAVRLQKLDVHSTLRNWKTVRKLEELAKAME